MKIEKYYKIINYLRDIIKDREFDGHVYSVGGCERDKHLGLQEIKDIDLVVDLKDGGIRFARWLKSRGLMKNGNIVVYENFGTAMFKLDAFPDEEIEVVHTRKETYRDKNSRNPETAFGTIEDDCFRRDFTVNSLYHNISKDEDVDLTGMGLEDLKNKVIRTCSEPDIIFSDDPLRIMRAVRFTSKLGFEIDENTISGIVKHAPRLKIISKERITDEFNKILTSPNPVLGFNLLWEYGIIDVIMDGLFTKKNHDFVLSRLAKVTKSRRYKLEMGLGVLFNNLTLSPLVREIIMKDFKYSNDIINEVNLYANKSWNVELACSLKLANRVREIAKECGDEEHFRNLVDVSKAMCIRKEGKNEACFDFLFDVEDIDMMFGYKLPVTGDDVMELLEIGPGPEIKNVLNMLMEEAYENPKISKGACMKLIKKYGDTMRKD